MVGEGLTLAQGTRPETPLPPDTRKEMLGGVADEHAGYDRRWGIELLVHSLSECSGKTWGIILNATRVAGAMAECCS